MDAPVGGDRLTAVLSHFQGVRAGASAFRAQCPAHGSTGGTLAISEGDAWILIHCFAGCDVADVLKAAGLTWKDIAYGDKPPRRRASKADKRDQAIEASLCAARLMEEPRVLERVRQARGWAKGALKQLGVGWDGERFTIPVTDKEGKPHDVLRYDPFRDRFKMLAGEGCSRQPWPAPETVSTLYRSRGLFVVEGEGTAISLASVGLPAVALPGSVGRPSGDVRRPGRFQGVGWHKTWAKRFYGHRRVYLVPDADEQGRTLMAAVEHDMRFDGINCVTIPTAGPKGWDLGDMLRRAHDLETRRQGKEMIRMLVSTATRQPDRLEDAQQMALAWAEWTPQAAPVEAPAFEAFQW